MTEKKPKLSTQTELSKLSISHAPYMVEVNVGQVKPKSHQLHQEATAMLRALSCASRTVTRPLQACPAHRTFYNDTVDAEKPVVSSDRNYNLAHLYSPEATLTKTKVNKLTGRPIPLNVDLVHHAPLQHPQTHGHLVAELKFAGFHWGVVHRMADMAQRAAYYLGIPASGIAPLPRKYKRWTVIRSPFAQAKSKQNFERVTYSRAVKLFDANPDTVQILLAVLRRHETPGVGIDAKLFAHESVDSLMATTSTEPVSEPAGEFNAEIAEVVSELLKDANYFFTPDEKFDARRLRLTGPNRPKV